MVCITSMQPKESGLECACVNNDDFTVLVSGVVESIQWSCVLCGHHIQNDWASRATNLHQILHQAWSFLCTNYSDDSEGHRCGQLMIGSFIRITCLLKHYISQPPCNPDLVSCNFWLFSELKSPSKGKRFQTINEIQVNMTEHLMVIGRSLDAYFEGDWNILS